MTAGADGQPRIDLDQLLEAAPVAIYVLDPAGRYVYVNKQYEIATGTPAEDVLGHTDDELYPPPVAATFRKRRLRTQEEMSPQRFEERVLIQGRERLISTVEVRILDEAGGVGVMGISIDITDGSEEAPGISVQRSRDEAPFGRLLASLTPQEVRVLDLVAGGLSDREIAEKLSLSSGTVRHHVSHLLKKLRKRRGQVIIEMLKRDRP